MIFLWLIVLKSFYICLQTSPSQILHKVFWFITNFRVSWGGAGAGGSGTLWPCAVLCIVAQLFPLFVSLWTVARRTPLSVGIPQARILEWAAMPSSRGSSQRSDQTQVSCIAGTFFTIWVSREAQEYWSRWPIPSPGQLPNPGIEPGAPALQLDSLPGELPGKPCDPIS